MAIATFALGLRGVTPLGHDVVHDLALVARHRRQRSRRGTTLEPHDGVIDECGEFGRASIPRSTDVENEP